MGVNVYHELKIRQHASYTVERGNYGQNLRFFFAVFTIILFLNLLIFEIYHL